MANKAAKNEELIHRISLQTVCCIPLLLPISPFPHFPISSFPISHFSFLISGSFLLLEWPDRKFARGGLASDKADYLGGAGDEAIKRPHDCSQTPPNYHQAPMHAGFPFRIWQNPERKAWVRGSGPFGYYMLALSPARAKKGEAHWSPLVCETP